MKKSINPTNSGFQLEIFYGGFHSHWGTPRHHPFSWDVSLNKNHPAMGYPQIMGLSLSENSLPARQLQGRRGDALACPTGGRFSRFFLEVLLVTQGFYMIILYIYNYIYIHTYLYIQFLCCSNITGKHLDLPALVGGHLRMC